MGNIYLLGFMGAGKSSVGQLLAEKLGLTFVDIDEQIVSEQNKSIPQIFAEGGEERFRALETLCLQKIAGDEGFVVATGGGIVEKSANLDCIKSSGVSIFLETDWDTLINRIGEDENRPLANSDDNWAGTRERFDRRLPLYRQADITVKTDDKEISALVDDIVRCLRNYHG